MRTLDELFGEQAVPEMLFKNVAFFAYVDILGWTDIVMKRRTEEVARADSERRLLLDALARERSGA